MIHIRLDTQTLNISVKERSSLPFSHDKIEDIYHVLRATDSDRVACDINGTAVLIDPDQPLVSIISQYKTNKNYDEIWPVLQ